MEIENITDQLIAFSEEVEEAELLKMKKCEDDT